MKKNIIIFLIVFGIFVFLPSNVLGKEFKQINQISKQEFNDGVNYSDTYKLDNGDYIVAGAEYLARISNKGNIIWINNDVFDNAYNTYSDIIVIDDFVYISCGDDLIKIDVSDGSIKKTKKYVYANRIVHSGNYIYSVSGQYIIKIDKDLNVVEEYNTDNDLEGTKYSHNVNVSILDNTIYFLNIVKYPNGTSSYTDNNGNEHTYNVYSYETRIGKIDLNLSQTEYLPFNEGEYDYYNDGNFFNDDYGNVYLVSGLIAKIDKNGNTSIIYMPPFYGDYINNNSDTVNYYASGTIIDDYLIVAGFSGLDKSNHKTIVDVYDVNNKLVEEYELKTDNESIGGLKVFNVSKTSNHGFIVKWLSGNSTQKRVLSNNIDNNMYLNITEFARINPVKINVKGMGNVKIKNSDCACGEMAELDITPKADYYLKSLVVRNSAGQKIEVKDNKFVMPCDGDVIIDAQFREITNPKTNSIIIISVIVLISAIVSTIVVRKRVKG